MNDAPCLNLVEPEMASVITAVIKKPLHSDTASPAHVSSHTSGVNEHIISMHQTNGSLFGTHCSSGLKSVSYCTSAQKLN